MEGRNAMRRLWLCLQVMLFVPALAGAGTADASVPAQPAAGVNPRTEFQYVFFRGTNGNLQESWHDSRWHGPRDFGWPASSSPAVAVGDDANQYVFWLGANGHIQEAWHDYRWHGPRDMGWEAMSVPAVAVNPRTDEQYVFWLAADGRIEEAWHDYRWHGPRGMGWRSSSSPSVAVSDSGQQYVFWRGPDGRVYDAWRIDRWHGPLGMGWQSALAPAVAVNPRTNYQFVFWQGAGGAIQEAWYNGRWHGPSNMGWGSLSSPAVAVADNSNQYVFWHGAGGVVNEAWHVGARWNGPRNMGWHLYAPTLVGCTASGNPFVSSGPSTRHVVALTFDDGPWPDTPQFLDVLEREHVPATFFQIGEQIGSYGQSVDRRMLADGDMIGDHTWDHANVSGGGSHAAWEISQTADAIRAATGGFSPCLFRAPGGNVSSSLISEAWSLGFNTINWDVDPRDWARPGADAIYNNVIAHAHNGAIILQHDGGGDRSQTLAALPREIDTLRSEGYGFVTLTDLLGLGLVYR